MTVGELKRLLERHPDDLPIVVYAEGSHQFAAVNEVYPHRGELVLETREREWHPDTHACPV